MSALVREGADTDVEAAVAHHRAHGWARLGTVLDDEALAALRARADAIMLGEIAIPGLFFQHDSDTGRYDDLSFGEGYVGPSLRYRKIEKLERDPLFRALIEHATFERVVRAVIPGDIAIYRAVLFSKSKEGGSNLPWHQDGGKFWGLDREPTLQIWTGLDDAELDGGCVEVVPGSHAAGLATPLGGVVPDALVEARGAEAAALPIPTRAGEALLIHNHVWHRSARSRSGHARRGFTVCYMSAETRCLRKKRAPREFVRVFADTESPAGERAPLG
jgi:ectoine hydroxylase-related dioxygenase (phytanoyl-CoA dioxygenase family)